MELNVTTPHIVRVDPVIRPEVRGLCARPYAGHPAGCPNWGARDTCPPAARPLGEVLDLARPVWAIWNRFDVAGHAARMRRRHPDWSHRQVICCRYWQPTARAQLRRRVRAFVAEHPALAVLYTPEACGVDVTATLSSVGVTLEWPPVQWTHQVALAGVPLDRQAKELSEVSP